MKKLISLLLIMFLVACSGDDMADKAASESADYDYEQEGGFESSEDRAQAGETESFSLEEESVSNQMVIYTGFIDILVDDYTTATNEIIKKVQEMNGYVVQSSEYQEGENENRFGEMVVRIPQQHFQPFMNHVASTSTEVLGKTTKGDDVTEEYVDLESRLRSKEAVEERLLSFMNDAEKTEDLLKISDDLAIVQQEIEQIKGRMIYLENHVAFSTVTINIQEKNVKIPEIQSTENLNTMENAMKLFMDTINFILNVLSNIIVFLIGLSPIIVPVAVVGAFILIKKRKNKTE